MWSKHIRNYTILLYNLSTSNAQVTFFFDVNFHFLLIQRKMRLKDEAEVVEHVPSYLNTEFRADIACI